MQPQLGSEGRRRAVLHRDRGGWTLPVTRLWRGRSPAYPWGVRCGPGRPAAWLPRV